MQEDRKLTIREIAKLCGISVSTVSRAINDHADINPETKKRVEEIIEKYGYVPNNSARNLKRNESRNIAVLVKGITNPFFTDMIKVFEQACQRENYSLVLEHVEDRQDEVALAALLEKEKRLSGIVFLGGNPMQSKEKLDRLQVPFVLCSVAVDDQAAYAPYSYVAIDDRVESGRVTDYLIQSGCRRIAILCAHEEDESIGALRLRGYLEAHVRHGLSADPALLLRPLTEDAYTYENGYRCIEKLLKDGTRFDAVYTISDSMAIGVLRALHDHGIRVPEDCSVAGFDGLPIGSYMQPSLTTLRQPVEEMAQESINALFSAIRDPETAEKHHCIFPGVLEKRESA